MYVRTKEKPNGKTFVQIVESCGSADKVLQKIVRPVGQAQTEMGMEEFRRLSEKTIIEMNNKREPILPCISA